MGMNGNRQTLVDRKGQTDETRRTDIKRNDDEH